MATYKSPLLLSNGILADKMTDVSDYDLFNGIHYTPQQFGRDNYVEGEEEGIWEDLNLYFDLPKYEPNKYGFLVNDKDKTVSLSTKGEQDGRGFGGWKVKPQNLGLLKRRSL